jgi:hypothetical protein
MSEVEKSALQLGGLYQTHNDERPYRIIGLDAIEVFYDCLWREGLWTFSGNFKKKVFFYRMSNATFFNFSKKIGILPLSSEELSAFRPDLPMRLGRTKMLSWNNIEDTTQSDFESSLENLCPELIAQSLRTNKIVLLPFGRKGGLKKGTIIQADNGSFIPIHELLWKAGQLQEAVNNQDSIGVGLYRLGFEKGIPSYYIGEFIDSAGICKE